MCGRVIYIYGGKLAWEMFTLVDSELRIHALFR